MGRVSGVISTLRKKKPNAAVPEDPDVNTKRANGNAGVTAVRTTLQKPLAPSPPVVGYGHRIYHPLHMTFHKLSEKYGKVYQVHMGSELWTVVNDAAVVNDLVVRGGVVSATGTASHATPAAADASPSDVVPYEVYLRVMFRLTRGAAAHINRTYQPILHMETQNFLARLHVASDVPYDPSDDLTRFIRNMLTSITFGSNAGPAPPDFARLNQGVSDRIKGGSFFPWMLSMSMSRSRDQVHARKRYAELSGHLADDSFKRLSLCGGTQNEYFASQLLSTIAAGRFAGRSNRNTVFMADDFLDRDLEVVSRFDEYDFMHMLSLFVSGGTAALQCQLRWIFAQLTYLPDVQSKIQHELGRIVGKHRLPSPEHFDKLHYLRAVIRECIRMRPLSFFTAPHVTDPHETFRGFHVKTMIANMSLVHYDNKLFPRARRFIPERFLNDMGELKRLQAYEDPLVFARGPQACIGQQLAERILCTVVAYTLSLFTIGRDVDPKTGELVELEMNGEPDGLQVDAPRAKLRFVPRANVNAPYILNANYSATD